jgi:hypothetical protein
MIRIATLETAQVWAREPSCRCRTRRRITGSEPDARGTNTEPQPTIAVSTHRRVLLAHLFSRQPRPDVHQPHDY